MTMKRLAITAAALALGAGFTSAAHAQPRQQGYRNAPPPQAQRFERWDERQHNGYYLNGRWNDGRPNAGAMRDRTFRPGFQAQRWDPRRHNGFMYQGRWHYGEPTRVIIVDRSFQPGYRAWRRGDRLTNYHRQQYRAVDYRRERLRAPPRGYQYVRSDRGETLLVAIATGMILSVILSGN